MEPECHVWKAGYNRVVELDAEAKPLIDAPAELLVENSRLRAQQETIVRCIDLNVGCSKANEFSNFLMYDVDDVSQKRIKRWIGASGIFRRPKVTPQAGARKCYLRNAVRLA